MLSNPAPPNHCAPGTALGTACEGRRPGPSSSILDGDHIVDGILPKQFANCESSLLESVSEGAEGLAQLYTTDEK